MDKLMTLIVEHSKTIQLNSDLKTESIETNKKGFNVLEIDLDNGMTQYDYQYNF